MIDNQIQPIIELVHTLGIPLGGARVFRRIDGVCARKHGEKGMIVAQPPGPVQEHERRPAAIDRDLGLDLVLPEPELLH